MTQQYTKRQCLDLATAFEKAAELLWTPCRGNRWDDMAYNNEFICHVMRRLTLDGVPMAAEAGQIVCDRLDNSATFYGWLFCKGVPHEDMSDENVQQHKLDWLRMLTDEFNEKARSL